MVVWYETFQGDYLQHIIATNFPRQIIKGGMKLAVDSHSQHQKETIIHWDQNGFVVVTCPFLQKNGAE